MSSARNKVIDGEFKGRYVFCFFNKVYIEVKMRPVIGSMRRLFLDQLTVASYQLVNYSSDISMTSAMARGVMGSMAAGDAGGIAGAMTARRDGVNVVLITFKSGRKSLIEINDIAFEFLEKNCMYNVRLNGNTYDSSFDEHREIKCPHCKNIAYGAVGEKCPYCKRPFSMPAKELKTSDKLVVVMLAVFYPIGVVLLWLNDSYYKDTKIKFTIIFAIWFISVWYVGMKSTGVL